MPTERIDGWSFRAKCVGEYKSSGHRLSEQFETLDDAQEWLLTIVTHDGVEEGQGRMASWLSLENGGMLRLDAVAVFEPIQVAFEREVASPENRRPRRRVREA